MPYNPNIHHRRSVRLKGYDYSQAGLYFITICCQDRICRFGKIENDEMILNEKGEIAYNEWVKLSEWYPHISFDVFQIMPNHIHGIIDISAVDVGATLAVALNNNTIAQNNNTPENRTTENNTPANRATARVAPTNATVGNIVGAYKSRVMNNCLEIYKSKNEFMGKFWQRNYYEHIIRNAQSHQNIFDYIINNPNKWTEDKFYVE